MDPSSYRTAPGSIGQRERQLLDLDHALVRGHGITIAYVDLADLIRHGDEIGASRRGIEIARQRLDAAAERGNTIAAGLAVEIENDERRSAA